MRKKTKHSTGLRVRSQLKAGFDKCMKCKLNCLIFEDNKKEMCEAFCNFNYC
jgi:hypothetical protein